MDNGKFEKSSLGAIVLTFVIALILNLIEYPQWMAYAKPDWVLLVLFYWCLALPNRIGVGFGWFAGLLLDIFYYSVLGQHAIAKAFVALVAVSSHRRLRLYVLWQQCFIVFLVASVDVAITIWIFSFTSGLEISIKYWQSAFTTCLLWPLVYNALRRLRHRTGIR